MHLIISWLKKHPLSVGIFLSLIIILGLMGQKKTTTDFYVVKPIDINYVTLASGTVRYPEPLNLTATEPGQIGQIAVKEGDFVKKGQLLIQLDNMKEQQNLTISQKNLTIAQMNLTNAASQTLPNLIEKAKSLGFSVKKAELDYNRSRQLAGQSMVTKSDLESAEQAYQNALTSFKQNQLELDSFSKNGIMATLKAQVEIARAQVNLAKNHLTHRRITAPFDGTISKINVQFQQNIQPNDVLAVALEKRNWILEADVDQKELPYLTEGLQAQVRFDAYPTEVVPAKLTQISPAIDTEKGTCTLKLEVLTPKPFIKYGMTGDLEIYAQNYPQVLGIPSQLIMKQPSGNFVVVWANKKAEHAPVTGKQIGEKWLIADNLPARTILLLPVKNQPLAKLRPGKEMHQQ